jgi:hypothetical protein
LPSGHATEAFIMAFVLWRLLRDSATVPYSQTAWGTQLMRLAARVAINRTVAGVHFPVDSAAGATIGLALGQYFAARCMGATTYQAWGFDGPSFPSLSAGNLPPEDGDFYWSELYHETAPAQTATAYAIMRSNETIAAMPANSILPWLWNRARAEWT